MPVVGDQISVHEVKVYAVMRQYGGFLSHREISQLAGGVSERTVRSHMSRFVRSGVAERVAVYPGFRFRALHDDRVTDREYLHRLHTAAAVLGVAI